MKQHDSPNVAINRLYVDTLNSKYALNQLIMSEL